MFKINGYPLSYVVPSRIPPSSVQSCPYNLVCIFVHTKMRSCPPRNCIAWNTSSVCLSQLNFYYLSVLDNRDDAEMLRSIVVVPAVAEGIIRHDPACGLFQQVPPRVVFVLSQQRDAYIFIILQNEQLVNPPITTKGAWNNPCSS